MMNSVLLLLTLGWLVYGGIAVAQDAAHHSILVEPADLLVRLSESNLRIVDVRARDDYADGHIPGAVRVDVSMWKDLAVTEDGLHDAEAWAEQVGLLGISENTHVIVYGSNTSNTARIWWLLKYVGVENTSLLNGGWDAWAQKQRPVDLSIPDVEPSRFLPQFQLDRLAEIDSVKDSLTSETVTLVDTRSDGEFEGGRIPGAVHLEWKHLLADDGRFKTPQQLKALFQKQGIRPSETAVCY